MEAKPETKEKSSKLSRLQAWKKNSAHDKECQIYGKWTMEEIRIKRVRSVTYLETGSEMRW